MSFLPSGEREYLESKGIVFQEIIDGSHKGVILPGFRLPSNKYDVHQAEVLIVLPPGYPDVPPDMFYLQPWVKLEANNRYPTAADQAFRFNGVSWQRWSRHNNEWRPGTDGIWTMLKRVEHALEVAA